MRITYANKYFKFLMYLVVVILLNVAGITLFFRIDLTSNKVYSLSKASKDVVANLSEPLTIKVFFTEDLPAPYNNIERYLRDLLEEYAVAGNRYFNYQFYNVSIEDERTIKNRQLAQDYGIYPVQIQNIEHDEIKFQRAYMGMVLIHGDLVETIPTITSTDRLEYRITSTIRKMNNKISALIRLKDKIMVKLFLSSSLQVVGPYMNITGLAELPGKIRAIVERLNAKNYGKLSFSHLDPSIHKEYEKEAEQHHVLTLHWNDFTDRRGKEIHADKGYAGIVVQHGDKAELLQLIRVYRLPIFGTQYQLVDLDTLEKALDETIEKVIDINEEIGYLADHGTPPLSIGFQLPGQTKQQESLSNFNKLVSEEYSLTPVNIKKEGIPEGLSFLLIAGPTENFSEYELYQIDQFLMKGNNLAIFLDAFKEVGTENRTLRSHTQGSYYIPLNTGLEKLLSHYGLKLRQSYILDKNSFRQKIPEMFGGGERRIYFAPIIKNEMINKDVRFLKNIKGLIMLRASPVEINEERIKEYGLKAIRLFSSSEKSWEMSGYINLNPLFTQPPSEEDKFKSMPMAYIIEGSFPSYFADKPIPEKTEEKEEGEEKKQVKKTEGGIRMSQIKTKGITIKKSKPAKIFLIGTSEILKDHLLDEEGKSPNAQFVMNVIDYMNNREDNAIMRSKTQRFNPLRDIKPGTRTFIKTANIAGPPVLVIIAGLIVWLRRASRKRAIQQIFKG